MLREDAALIHYGIMENIYFFLCTHVAAHALVVQSAHGHGVYVVVFAGFGHTGVELVVYGLAVGLVVPVAVLGAVPFFL